jgi:aspartate racemase
MATAYFYELITKMTDSLRDQDHLDIVIFSKPSIPDRTSYILGYSKDSPLDPMVTAGMELVKLGAQHIAIPCITAHYFHDELSQRIKVPVLHGIQETVRLLKEYGIKRAGIMATDGTIQSKLFQKEMHKSGISTVIPDEMNQRFVMDLIYHCIKSNLPADMYKFNNVVMHLKEDGAEAIVLGCTELSLIKRDYPIGFGFLDVMEVLARLSIQKSGGCVKEKYSNLLMQQESRSNGL